MGNGRRSHGIRGPHIGNRWSRLVNKNFPLTFEPCKTHKVKVFCVQCSNDIRDRIALLSEPQSLPARPYNEQYDNSGMTLTGEKRITLKIACPNVTSSTTYLTWIGLGSNMGLHRRGRRLA
jgi:hypothetical protein